MKILALDISSVSTGSSIVEDGYISSDFGLILTNKKHSQGQKLSFFKKEIVCLMQCHSPDYIVVEDIFKGRNMTTFKILAQFRGVAIQTIYAHMGSEAQSFLAVEARRIVGLGTKKEDAFADAVKKFSLKGFDFKKHNDIVDAMVLGMAYWHILAGSATKTCTKKRKAKHKKNKRKKQSK